MTILKLFKKRAPLCQEEMARPFFARAHQALLGEDLLKAVAILDSGIRAAPNHLGLYLKRGQILQYGLENYSKALNDYRYIIRTLESTPDHHLVCQCKKAMKDMMMLEANRS